MSGKDNSKDKDKGKPRSDSIIAGSGEEGMLHCHLWQECGTEHLGLSNTALAHLASRTVREQISAALTYLDSFNL